MHACGYLLSTPYSLPVLLHSSVRSYFNSFYLSLSIFTGYGDNDLYSRNAGETVISVLYVLVNVIVQAYILGLY